MEQTHGTSEEIIKIVIPSYRRAERVTTLEYVANCSICVPEREEAAYKHWNPNTEIITHPDDVVGMPNKRQWMVDHFGGQVFMLDDDITGMYRLYIGKNSGIRAVADKLSAYSIIQATAHLAKELGAYLFGFSMYSDPRNYAPQTPFRLKGYINGYALGVLKGSKLFFHPEAQVTADYFVSLLNAYHHRYCLVDQRYGFKNTLIYVNPGGLSEIRTTKVESDSYAFVQRMFGSAIRDKRKPTSTRGQYAHKAERMIVLPF